MRIYDAGHLQMQPLRRRQPHAHAVHPLPGTDAIQGACAVLQARLLA
jgi:hypothetical protein